MTTTQPTGQKVYVLAITPFEGDLEVSVYATEEQAETAFLLYLSETMFCFDDVPTVYDAQLIFEWITKKYECHSWSITECDVLDSPTKAQSRVPLPNMW